jgi:hypothetical protein
MTSSPRRPFPVQPAPFPSPYRRYRHHQSQLAAHACHSHRRDGGKGISTSLIRRARNRGAEGGPAGEMGKNQAYKAMQRSRLGSSSGAPGEGEEDGMVGPLPNLHPPSLPTDPSLRATPTPELAIHPSSCRPLPTRGKPYRDLCKRRQHP